MAGDWEERMEAYLRLEPNEHFRQVVEQLKRTHRTDELRRLFSANRLAFGTAGLRGPMGPGFGQMNDLVVIQTTQGLVSYVLESLGKNVCRKRGVIIGHDARHHSARFARLAAIAFLHKSIPVYFCDQIVPTPLVAFGVTYFNCFCGLMITASHNPKQDNGYKVYWANGAQILSPHDKNIQQHILHPDNQEPWESAELSYAQHQDCLAPALSSSDNAQQGPTNGQPTTKQLPLNLRDLLHQVYDDLCRTYFAYIQRLVYEQAADVHGEQQLSITYTTLHGVGHHFLTKALGIAGFTRLHAVEAQREPDPDFPTVRLPNPEEAGALDLAFETAARTRSRLILANDPDADRCAAALLDPTSGRKRALTGNEIGQLLGWWAWHTNSHQAARASASLSGSGSGGRPGGAEQQSTGGGPVGVRTRSSSSSGRSQQQLMQDFYEDLDVESTTDKTPATPITKPIIGTNCKQVVSSRKTTPLPAPPSTSSAKPPARAAEVVERPRRPKSSSISRSSSASSSGSSVLVLRRPEDCYMLSTAVSSRFLQTMARQEGFKFIETLTGFKHMGNVAHDLLKRGKSVLFAYEEALGYMVDSQILDKDGISAAVQLAQCAAYLSRLPEPRTLETQLDWLHAKYGYHYSLNSYFLCHEPRTIRAIFHELQSNYPTAFVHRDATGVEQFKVSRLRDLNTGIDNGTPDHKPDLPTSSSSFMVTFWIGEQIRFTIRTSGTEPKIKFYSEIVVPLGGEAEAEKRAARQRLARFVAAAVQRCLRPDFYNLEPAPAAAAD